VSFGVRYSAEGRLRSVVRRRELALGAVSAQLGVLGCVGLLSLVPAALAGETAPRTLYVSHTDRACSDSGPGSEARPFCTIQAAAVKAQAGETVRVAAGVYRENVVVVTSGTRKRPIVFEAARRGAVVLRGQANGFTISRRHWVTVTGFVVTHTQSYGIWVLNSSFITISNNHVSYAGQRAKGLARSGIYLDGTHDSLVAGNVSGRNSYAGIQLAGGSTRNEVRGNTTFANASGYVRQAPGIRVNSAPGNTIDRNLSYDNEDSGIECYANANKTLVYENVSYRNGDHGIDNHDCVGNRVIANTIYDNVAAGINVEAGSTGTTVADNISVDNGIASPRTHSDIRVERGSTAGTVLDSDLVFLSSAATLVIWNSMPYRTLAAFQDATGQEVHGIEADPRWADPQHGNFELSSGSPAIDSADSTVSGWPATDIQGHRRIDDPATPNTGIGPRRYADRGAYEYRPPHG
jgi:parallel beta-helix repeat protein